MKSGVVTYALPFLAATATPLNPPCPVISDIPGILTDRLPVEGEYKVQARYRQGTWGEHGRNLGGTWEERLVKVS